MTDRWNLHQEVDFGKGETQTDKKDCIDTLLRKGRGVISL